MSKITYTTRPVANKVAVLRCSVYYPKGNLITKFSSQEAANLWVARQVSEDKLNRAEKVMTYLAERANRASAVAVEDNQIAMF